MKLTKKQRNEIYKKALTKLKNGYDEGVCCLLDDLSRDLTGISAWWKFDDLGYIELFPEILAFKPRNGGGYWWSFDEEGNESRIEAVEKCIELTK